MQANFFMGFPLNNNSLSALEHLAPPIREYFVDNGADYLQTLEHGKNIYLGKQIPPLTPLETFENIQENIYSILYKMLPKYPFKETDLIIFLKIESI